MPKILPSFYSLYTFDSVINTMWAAKKSIDSANLKSGALFLSLKQLLGRGRYKRLWSSEFGNFYISLVLSFFKSANKPSNIAFVLGLSLQATLSLYLQKKKLN